MPKLTDQVIRHKLSDGLTVLVKEEHANPIVAIYTYVKVGYFNEPDELAGISHLIEHMFFKGTERRRVGEIARETKMLGGYLNASTIYDHTLYYTVLPSRNFAQGLDIQSDALINSTFNAEELQKEIEVVIQESNRKLDTPTAFAREKLFELAFTKHRMRRWRIGTEQGLRALTRDDFVRFYEQYYRPENIILSVVGDIETKQALELIEQFYAPLEKKSLKKQDSPAEPPQKEFRFALAKGDIQKSHLAIGFHTPEILHEDTHALEILALILGEGRSSRLNQNVKEAQGLVNSISAYNWAFPTLGIFMIESITRNENLRAAEQAIFQELQVLHQDSVTTEELEKARNLLEASYIFSTQSVSGQANLLSGYEAIGGYQLLESYLEKLCAVDKADLQRVLDHYIRIENCSLFEYVPATHTLEELRPKAINSFLPNTGQRIKTKTTDAISHAKLFNITTSSNANSSAIETCILNGGAKLVVKYSPEKPIISCGVFTRGGRIRENSDNCGISGLMARTALKGTQKRNASQIATEIENLGSSIGFSSEADFFGCTTTALSKHFTKSFEILTDVLTQPVFPGDEIEREKQQTLHRIAYLRDDMFRYPINLFYEKIFRNHPYGLPALGTEDSIGDISQSSLAEWHKENFVRENMLIVVVGDCTAEKIKNLIEENLRDLPENKNRDKGLRKLGASPKRRTAIETRDKKQTAMVIGFPGPNASDKDFYTLTVLQNIISGLGGRFFEELRGKQSLAYTVTAYLMTRVSGGAFLSYIATGPENESRARDGLLHEFEKLKKELVTEEELRRSIQYTTGTHTINLESSRAQMYEMAYHDLMGRGFETINTFPETISKVTRQDILQAACKYFDPEKYVESLVRGKSD